MYILLYLRRIYAMWPVTVFRRSRGAFNGTKETQYFSHRNVREKKKNTPKVLSSCSRFLFEYLDSKSIHNRYIRGPKLGVDEFKV